MQRRVGDMEVETRAAQARVPQQQLDAAEVNSRFEEMGRETVPKEMGINGLGELGSVARLAADMGDAHAGDGLGDPVSRKEPGLELIELPVAPEQRQQIRGEHHEAIALAFALAHLDDHPFRVDVGTLEPTEFGDPYPGGIEGGKDGAMLEMAWSQQQRFDLITTEDDGQRLGLLGVRDVVGHPWSTSSGFVQKPQGTDRLDKDALGGVLLEEMELIGADVLSTEAIRRGVEVLGELRDVAQIAIDGVRRVVTNLHVFEHALP